MVLHIYQKDIEKLILQRKSANSLPAKGYWEIDIAKKVGKFIASKYSKMELSSLSQVL